MDKRHFIKAIRAAENSDEIQDAIDSLPNCYAKGYIYAKYEEFTENNDDYEEAIEEIVEWANYEIWI